MNVKKTYTNHMNKTLKNNLPQFGAKKNKNRRKSYIDMDQN